MEWPKADVEPDELFAANDWNDPHTDYELVLSTITSTLITKEIYARAAMACVADITIDHDKTGLRSKVDTFLHKLRKSTADDDTDHAWITSEYRTISRDFVELMSFASSLSYMRIYEICQGGLDAVHDLLKYRLPAQSDNNAILTAKDAYVLCQRLSPKLTTERLSGTRAPDIDYKFGIYEENKRIHNLSVDINENNSLYGLDACNYVTQLRNDGYMETSACSLAKYTFTANNNIISSQLVNKTFIVLGCDHPLSPTKSLLRIPGVTLLGIPTSWNGLDEIIEYVQYNSPDDTTFIYPTGGGEIRGFDGNYILSHGPHIAQWILENTEEHKNDTNNNDWNNHRNNEHELVIVPMPPPKNSSHKESAVRYAAASDLIVQRVLRARHNTVNETQRSSSTSNTKISLWMYQNSTTCMVVPPASTTKSKESLKQRPSHEPWLHTLSMNTVLTPTIDEENKVESTTTTAATEKKTTAESSSVNHDYAIVNGIIATPGGAHDVLAETIRLWRCLLTNLDPHFQHGDDDDDIDDYDSDDDGKGKQHRNTTAARNEIHVFAPYVPLLKKTNADNNDVAAKKKNNDNDDNDDSSYFLSAEYNELLVRESKVKVFDVGTASSLMTAIGLATILDPIVNRPLPTFLDNDVDNTDGNNRTVDTTPFSLFWNGSVSGGIWNCPYTLNSVTGYAGYVLGKLYNYYDTYAAPYLVSTSDENNNTNTPNNNDGTTTNTTTETTTTNDVPSTLGEPMPDIVRERLEILA